jgi:Arc/MetJ-type ribon-helix-helix transcriptional regulator
MHGQHRSLTGKTGMTYSHTVRLDMSRSKIAISIDQSTLQRLDELVGKSIFPSRSQAIQEAVQEKLVRLDRSRLARECSKLDPKFEKTLAEEGLSEDLSEWPEY